ncbi:MAG: ABC transporter permease [Trueperaceae bacterium]|nr:ABC transporter permease [Trueperaceae bacterium]
MPLLPRLALRNLLRHRWRTLATVLGVALGIAAVLATLSVGANVDANIRATLEAAAGPADLLVTPGATGRAVFEFAPTLEAVAADPAIAWAVPVLNVRAEPERGAEVVGASGILPGVDTGFQLGGRVMAVAESLPLRVASGRLPVAGAAEVAIAEGFASGRDLEIGDQVGFSSQAGRFELTLVGLLDDRFALATTNGGRVGVTDLVDLQGALAFERRASHLEVGLVADADVDAARSRLQATVGEAYTVTYPAGAGDATSGIVQTLQSGLLILAATLMALGGFMAYNTFMAGVVERTREYALLRTICMKRGDVRRLALYEAAWVSLAGVVTGLALGVALAAGLNQVNAIALGYEPRTLVVPLRAAAIAAGVGVIVALLAASLPARAAARTSPLGALRDADVARDPRLVALGWVLVALGVVFSQLPWSGYAALFGTALAMATFFGGVALAAEGLIRPAVALARPLLGALLGPAGRLGAGFTIRNASRNGVAVGTVIVGTGLIIGVGSMVEGINRAVADWVDTTIVGDLFITAAAPFPADFEARAATVPGVDQVSGVGLRVVRYEPEGVPRGRTVALVLVDPARFDPAAGFGSLQYISGQGDAARGFEALQRGGVVLAANTIRDRFGVGVGDTARLRTDDGFVDFPVEGVVVDYTGGGETFLASIRDLPRFGGGSPDLFVATVDAGTDAGAARAALLEAFPDVLLDVTLNQAYRDQIESLMQQSFATTNTLLLLAALIAALGVANTLGMNLSRRAHEIAVLRTVGLRRAGVRRLVTAEGIVVLTLGAVLGVTFGLLLADVITAGTRALTGYAIEAVVPWRMLIAAVLLTPILGFLASWLPARRAARLAPCVALGASESA